MSLSLCFHDITSVTAKRAGGRSDYERHWVDITFTDSRGISSVITVFTDNAIYAARLTQVINQVTEETPV